MIISRGRRYVFVHAPKTGGTAMALALENRAMAEDILIGDTPKAVRRRQRLKGLEVPGRLWKHSTLRDVDGLLSAEEMQSFLIFTLVRNPWDRVVSYYHWLRAQSFDHPSVALSKSLDFKSFMMHPAIGDSFRAHPFASYVRPAPDPVFVRLEHLAQDLAPVEAHLGFSLKLSFENQSVRSRDFRDYYDSESRVRVADFCAEDIKRFGYRFDA